jgi:hypothetical protein
MRTVLVVQTCESPVELGQDHVQDVGEIKILSA